MFYEIKFRLQGRFHMIIGLSVILLLVLFLPFSSPAVERNLELFLFLMGIAAVAVSGTVSRGMVLQSIKDPIHITIAVIAAGILFKWTQKPFELTMIKISAFIPVKLLSACIVVFLGFISSIITAIIAAIVLSAIAGVLPLDRQNKIRLVIIACFSIGMGAVLTPIGEPLSTITVSKLSADFFYLLRLLGTDIATGIIILGIFAALIIKPAKSPATRIVKLKEETFTDIFFRGGKIYLFVMALTLLGAGFEPFIEKHLLHLHPAILYWVNMVSAVLDNATLAAAEISPDMNNETIRAILLGLLVSGGMLIPGNIPNIIVAGKLDITSVEWAKFGVPVGLAAMVIYFISVVF